MLKSLDTLCGTITADLEHSNPMTQSQRREPMKQDPQQYLKFAFRTSILIEKQSLDFYNYAAKLVNDEQTRQVFKRLALEEGTHVREFHSLYQEFGFGNLNKLICLPPNFETPIYRSLIASVKSNTQEKEALEIALREEESCIETYTKLISSISESGAHKLFQEALSETHAHCRIIQAEYDRVIKKDGKTIDAVYEPARPTLQTIIPKREDIILPGRNNGNPHRMMAPAYDGHVNFKASPPSTATSSNRSFRIIA
jgi:rubrerythrin